MVIVRNDRFERSLVIILFVVLLGALVGAMALVPVHRWADTSTYYMQISSIADDFDIQYQPVDINRALANKFDDLPAGLFLIKTKAGQYFYGKEFSYASFAAIFFLLLGNHGILIFNGILFWLMILMGYLYLRGNGNRPILSFSVSAAFFLLSAAFIYLFWVHAEIYNFFLITAGLFFWTQSLKKQDNISYLILAALIFGLATVAKAPNGLLFLPILIYELWNRKPERAVLVIIAFLLPLIFFYGIYYIETGSISTYGGNRLYYISAFPFTGNYNATNEIGTPSFSIEEGRISGLINLDNAPKSGYNLFYYFFGKFTGIAWYYPLALFGMFSFFFSLWYCGKRCWGAGVVSVMRKDPARWLIFIGIVLNILFFVIIIGNNYFGGGYAFGNRYFYIFPAFLFLVGKIDLKIAIPFIIIALITIGPSITDPISTSGYLQRHTYLMPYTLFPVEYSQANKLPLYGMKAELNNQWLYYLGPSLSDRTEFAGNNSFWTEGSSRWLIKVRTDPNMSVSKSDSLGLLLAASDENAKRTEVIFHLPSADRDIVIPDSGPVVLNLPLDHPQYTEGVYRLYEITIVSPSKILMTFEKPEA